MSVDTYLFEIPVYAWSLEEHYRKREAVREQWVAVARESGSPNPQRYGEIGVSIHAGYGWHYNVAVGWLRMMADGWAIKTYLWWTSRQRISRQFTRTPLPHRYEALPRQVAEIHVKHRSSEQIYLDLLDDLQAAARRSPLRGNHVDLSCFTATGPHVDWRAALGISD